MPKSEAMAKFGTMCSVSIVGRPGMSISQLCIDFTCLPSGRLIVSGFVAGLLFFTSTPSMTNIKVAPVSAMACEAAIIRAFKYCGMGLPNDRLAVLASDVGNLFGSNLFVTAFNMMTVMSSFATSLSYTALMFSVGSGYLLYLFPPHTVKRSRTATCASPWCTGRTPR
jgi:hypothetical protein